MSSETEFSITRPLSVSEIISQSFLYYFKNIYVILFYFIAFLIFAGYLFVMMDLGYPNSLSIDVNALFNSININDPNFTVGDLLGVYSDLLFFIIGERLVISFLLAIPYALTVSIIDRSFKRNYNLLLGTNLALTDSREKFSHIENMKISFKKMAPKFFSILLIAIILNFLVIIGSILFLIPGIIISVFLAMLPVIVILEPQRSFGSLFSRSTDLIKGSFFKVLSVLILIGLLQFVISFFLQLMLSIIYALIQSPDLAPSTSPDVVFVMIQYIGESFIAPLSIISLVLLYHDLKLLNSNKIPLQFGVPSPQRIFQPKQQISTQYQNPFRSSDNTIFCIHCGKANPSFASYCAFCGKNLGKDLIQNIQQEKLKSTEISKNSIICTICGKPSRKIDDKFCQYCGNKY